MKRLFMKLCIVTLLSVCLFGCAGNGQTAAATYETGDNPLRVGISADYPPMIFDTEGKIQGVEADLARMLGERLRKPVRFTRLNFGDLISELMAGRIDIIMSGMSITDARKIRIAFTEPYMKTGLMTLIRSRDASRFKTIQDVVAEQPAIGIVRGTTGDVYVQKNFPTVRRIPLSKAESAVFELKVKRIDAFVYDGPALVWLVSENEADLAGIWTPLTEEYLAWGIAKDNTAFLSVVNGILAQWKQDGTLDAVISRWLPYFSKK